jgi:hypothetical protein
MTTNPERQSKWPRLPWQRWAEWRPRWDRPEAEALAEKVEDAWAREPLHGRVARRLIVVARALENRREPARAGGTWFEGASEAEKARVRASNAAENQKYLADWLDHLRAVERALGEIERERDAAANRAPQGGDDGDIV